jgi:hypothetical protein
MYLGITAKVVKSGHVKSGHVSNVALGSQKERLKLIDLDSILT